MKFVGGPWTPESRSGTFARFFEAHAGLDRAGFLDRVRAPYLATGLGPDASRSRVADLGAPPGAEPVARLDAARAPGLRAAHRGCAEASHRDGEPRPQDVAAAAEIALRDAEEDRLHDRHRAGRRRLL